MLRRFLRPRRLANKPDANLPDEDLLARFQQHGQMEALSLLYDRYLELVYGLCLRYLADENRAEDAVMAIFEALLQKVPQHQIQHFRNWLHTFVRNHCLMQLRREQRDPTFNFDPQLMQSSSELHPLEEGAADSDHLPRLHQCIERLPEQQKQCIQLFYFEEKSYQEIALARSEPLGQVRSHLQNGRRNLKICMGHNHE
jgi:RNA polymerase sigma-70 factor (ECF subfamily)